MSLVDVVSLFLAPSKVSTFEKIRGLLILRADSFKESFFLRGSANSRIVFVSYTLSETNMEVEHVSMKEEIHLQIIDFGVPCWFFEGVGALFFTTGP